MRTLTPTREPMASHRPRCVELGRGGGGATGGATTTGGGAGCVACGVAAAWACVGIGVGAAPGRGVNGASMSVSSDEYAAAAAGVFAAGAGVDDATLPGTAVVRAGGS